MTFNYGLLKEKIKDEFGTAENFARTMGIGSSRMSLLLNGKADWSSELIYRAVELLGLEGQIEVFFFTPKFGKPNRSDKC